MDTNLKAKVLEIVKAIPDCKVMYFGQIAKLTGSNPRTIGWIMSGLSENEMEQVPWYRVVAKSGYISSLKLGFKGVAQKDLLQKENYKINGDFVDMETHGYME